MLKKYPNVVVDSAFSSEDEIKKISKTDDFKNRILWGTDFPVTYWYENRDFLTTDPEENELSLFYKNQIKRGKKCLPKF